MRSRRSRQQESDLDITSFMNLMIILVPVLLMTMVFSHITVLDITLPDISNDAAAADAEAENRILEVVVRDDRLVVNYPAGVELRTIPHEEGEPNFEKLSLLLREVKRQLRDKGIDKRDILLLSEPDTDYQTLVSAMDTVRSYSTVMAASVVNAELFPEISLGDAPPTNASQSNAEGEQ